MSARGTRFRGHRARSIGRTARATPSRVNLLDLSALVRRSAGSGSLGPATQREFHACTLNERFAGAARIHHTRRVGATRTRCTAGTDRDTERRSGLSDPRPSACDRSGTPSQPSSSVVHDVAARPRGVGRAALSRLPIAGDGESPVLAARGLTGLSPGGRLGCTHSPSSRTAAKGTLGADSSTSSDVGRCQRPPARGDPRRPPGPQ